MTVTDPFELKRRDLLVASAVCAASTGMPAIGSASPDRPHASDVAPGDTVTFSVNGETRTLDLDPRTTLLDALREHLHLTGTKKGCDHGATVETVDASGKARAIPIADFHRLPADTPHVETSLAPGELITAVTLPKPAGGTHVYRKVRDRASYAFALVSVAAVIRKDGTGHVAVGGVAPKPWRLEAAEAVMPEGSRALAAHLLADARPTGSNAFKVPLVERALAAVMADAKAI